MRVMRVRSCDRTGLAQLMNRPHRAQVSFMTQNEVMSKNGKIRQQLLHREK